MRARWLVVASLLPITTSSAVADSETYEQIRFDGGMTGAWVGVSDRNGGGLVAEIKAMLTDDLAIGGRVELAMMFGGVIGNDDLELGFALVGGAVLKAEYYLVPGVIRPFVSAGVGVYSIGAQSVESGPNTTGIHTDNGQFVGLAPQIGIDIWRFRFAATYNALYGASLEFREMTPAGEQRSSVSQNYLSLEMSFQFSGGKKQRPARPPMQYTPQPYPPPPQPQPQPQPQPPSAR